MRPRYWHPPRELNGQEQSIVKRIKRAKLFIFLRECRHLIFDESFQEELNKIYADANKGQPPIPPVQLALVTILQAYTGVSDAEAIEALVMDRRWQLVLDCIDCEQAPSSQTSSKISECTNYSSNISKISECTNYLSNISKISECTNYSRS
jgi:hypothetical protein